MRGGCGVGTGGLVAFSWTLRCPGEDVSPAFSPLVGPVGDVVSVGRGGGVDGVFLAGVEGCLEGGVTGGILGFLVLGGVGGGLAGFLGGVAFLGVVLGGFCWRNLFLLLSFDLGVLVSAMSLIVPWSNKKTLSLAVLDQETLSAADNGILFLIPSFEQPGPHSPMVPVAKRFSRLTYSASEGTVIIYFQNENI